MGGLKYIKNYHPNDYSAQPQNWAILQDRRGVIYVGNHGAVLEFDGVSWKRILIPNLSVRSVAMDDTGTIYIGGEDEIGFLAPDSKKGLRYVSLVNHLENNKRDFYTVWRTHATKEGIYFRPSKFLFRWDYREMKVWEAEHYFNASLSCKGKFFIQQKKVGLMHIKNNSLKLIPGGETFAEMKISMMVPYDSEKVLIGTRAEGLYIYDGIEAVPFPTDVDDYLREKQLYHGIRLSSSFTSSVDFALGTLQGGLVIIDSHGHLKQIFDKASGLQDDNIKYVYEDSQGNLWLGLNNGISKIEYTSPISLYDNRLNLPGLVLSVIRHGPYNDLYVGTTSGLYSFASSSSGKFTPVPGMSGNCFSIISIDNSLFSATDYGVFTIENNIKRKLIENYSYVLLQSKKEPNRVWVGTRQGLVSLYRENQKGQWTEERKFENITQEIRTIVEDKKGNLWLGTITKGVIMVDFTDDETMTHPVVTHYSYDTDTSHGLPPEEVHVFMAAGHVMFATKKGIFRFDEKNRLFIPDPTLGAEFADGSKGVFCIIEDKNKNIWLHSRVRNIRAIPQTNGSYVLSKKPFLRIPPAQVNAIYPDGDSIWFGGVNGLIRYEPSVKKDYDYEFSTFIRKVVINGKLVFDGYKIDNDSKRLFPIIDYKDRNLRFEFAAPFFEDESSTEYQCLLKGYDKDWSFWTKENRKDYTNLDSGLYTFRVRARNVYENLSREDVFQFKVLPPWYKTWWAFSIYALTFFLILFLIVKWRSWKLEEEKQRLEQIIKERTKEIKEKNLQLEEQSEKLKEMDQVKSRFFANISHEFRTPLTLIMGPLEQMLSQPGSGDREQRKKLKLMLRNSQRLLNLINQLLDLSKFESGKMKLLCSRQNIVPFLKGILASFEILAEQNEQDLQFHAQEENITLYFDPEKLEKVLYNLLSNAFKFTPPGGRITVIVTKNLAKEDRFLSGSVDISVFDTGIGIPEAQLPHIFDHFYQVDVSHSHEHKYKGSGIGLALTKELVTLHHGDIDVRSREGQESGTEFILRLPMGKEHLKPDQIIDDSRPESTFEPVSSGEIPALYMAVVEEKEKEESDEDKDIDLEAHEKNIILVVEDSADVRNYIRGSLEPLYTVVEAVDGREGIKKAEEIIPDLIISDILMPEVDGYELCRVLKKDVKTSHIPIILLTAKASEESIVEGLETGADDYITKPFNTRILYARIKNLIDIRRQLQLRFDREITLHPPKLSVSNVDKDFIKDLQGVIEANLSEPDFNVEELVKKLYIGRTTLYRKIQALFGASPTDFIKSYRLQRAAELLKSDFGSVTEVAFEVGFSSRTYFTKCFKEKFRQLPSEFQASKT
jgi:signal transduction histidine kinase/DNA-binding NarL/FixJ family response regulator